MRSHEINDSNVGSFARDGALTKCELVYGIGNVRNFIGSYLVGRVVYQCIDRPLMPSSNMQCSSYESSVIFNT